MSASISQRYELLDIHDSRIRCITIDLDAKTCSLDLHGAALLKDSSQPFEYEAIYEPARLVFREVCEIKFPEGYCLNRLIVTDSIVAIEGRDLFRFSLSMTGGWDNDTFMRTIEIVAKDFSLSGEISAPSQAE
jgi:hypothetical protein